MACNMRRTILEACVQRAKIGRHIVRLGMSEAERGDCERKYVNVGEAEIQEVRSGGVLAVCNR